VSGNGREWLDIIREIGRKQFAAIRSIAGVREIYAAGGVRDAADLLALKAAAAAGALISTALHERRIVAADLQGM
jgi:phosphoribosylformimino-5-aminoimidazole carboxamide ribonucleotide (ProFAR) isomerase